MTNPLVLTLLPPSPGYFRWQRVRDRDRLPVPLRDIVQPIDTGESYWLALGGRGGFSSGALRYPHRLAAPVEVPLGDEAEDGLSIRVMHLSAGWAPGTYWLAAAPDVHLEFGRWETAPDGSPRWVVGYQNVYATPRIRVPLLALAGATHMRVIKAGVMPQLAVIGTSVPTYEPLFSCAIAVMEVE